MITTVIIDAEPRSRKLLRAILLDSCERVSIIGEATDVKSGIELLQNVKPDIVLMGIEMPDGDGFDILNALSNIHFKTIFITDYDHYAIKAIKYAALDYLLKPVEQEELQLAIKKSGISQSYNHQQWGVLYGQLSNTNNQLQEVILPNRNGRTVVDVQSIIRIEAKGSYVVIYLENNKSHLVVNSLSYYEELLLSNSFFRIHKSHLINITKMKSFALGRSNKVFLKDGSELNIAARRKSAFNQFVKQVYR